MKTYIARDLFKSLFIACVLTLAGATAFGQGPTRTDVRLCSFENKKTVVRQTPKTPRFVGSANYVRPGGRAAWILPFNRWSNKRKRINRKFIVR